MKITYSVQGMHCKSCVGKVTAALSAISGVRSVSVDLAASAATVEGDREISLKVLQEEIAKVGNYTITHRAANSVLWKKLKKVTPLLGMLGVVILFATLKNWSMLSVSHLSHGWMIDFMAGFFLLFGFLKVLNIRTFSEMYATYDVVAKRFPAWGYVYAIAEVILGVLYLTRTELLWVSVATLVLMSVATVGVYQKLRSKDEVICACLGGFFNVPVTWLTFVENVAMIAMAAVMVVGYF